MVNTRIILSGIWVAVMLTYLWGDVLRIIAGDFEPGNIGKGIKATQGMYLGIAIIMLIPIVMILLTLTLNYPMIRWVNIVAALFLIVFNLLGLPYSGAYDNFLIIVSIVFKAVIVGYAWKWVA